MQDSAALLQQPRLGTQELPSRGRFPRFGRAREERLLVQEVRPFERIVGQLEGARSTVPVHAARACRPRRVRR